MLSSPTDSGWRGAPGTLAWRHRWAWVWGLKGVWVTPSSIPSLALPVLSVLCQSGPVAQTYLSQTPDFLPLPVPLQLYPPRCLRAPHLVLEMFLPCAFWARWEVPVRLARLLLESARMFPVGPVSSVSPSWLPFPSLSS